MFGDRRRRRRRRTALVLAGLVCLAAVGIGTTLSAPPPAAPLAPLPAPPKPSGGREVSPGDDLQKLIDEAEPGAILYLSPGSYPGPLSIQRPLTIWGPREAVVRSNGLGNTIDARADGVRLLGFSVDGSGDRPDKMDSAIHVEGDDFEARGLRIVRAYFGFVVEKSNRATLAGNEIVGDPSVAIGLRGDAIRFWETRDSVIKDNRVTDCRDVLVWYSPDNRIINNDISRGRYGTHFMYCDGGVIEGGLYRDNTVGIFVMYSRNVQARGNLTAGSASAGGMGLGVKDSGNLIIENNRFVQDQVGIYLDNSPSRLGDRNRVEGNLITFCETGIVFHSSPARNEFLGNTFQANQHQARVDGRGDALETTWRGNAFDDYQGYDLDGDSFGDVPHEARNLANQMIGRIPELAFFRGTPALGLLEAVGRIFPLFQPEAIFVDPQPRMKARGS